MSEQDRRQRLRFRSWHRGTREMDLLMGSFADAHIATFTPEQLDQYENLLQISDPDLYSWIIGAEALPAEHQSEMMDLLCRHQYAKAD
jgi:antitoxin CptB